MHSSSPSAASPAHRKSTGATAPWTFAARRDQAGDRGGTAGVIARPGPIHLHPLRLSAVLAVSALLLLLCLACSGSDSKPTPTRSSPSPTASPDPPSPTPASELSERAFSADRALEHDRILSVDIGARPAGSEAERQAAEYIRDELSSYGYDAALQPFTIDSFVDLGTTLEVTSPEPRSIQALALGGTTSALAEGPVVAAGLGRPQEIPLGTQGSILLIQRGDITFSSKVANAEAAGAIGVIVYNSEAGVLNGQLNQPGGIPAAGISQADGQAILALIAAGPTTVRLQTRMETRVSNSHNVVATPPGGGCSIVAGGHYDSVPAGPGANDNASGTAVVLEIARTRAAIGSLDAVCYVLFGSEEIGLIGSAHYVQSLTPDQVSGLEAMLNFDMLAVGNEWPLVGSPEITDLAAANADRLGIPYTIEPALPENVGSDHVNFIGAGVPSIIFNCFCDEHYHSARDTFEFVLPERLSQAGQIGLGIIDGLLAP